MRSVVTKKTGSGHRKAFMVKSVHVIDHNSVHASLIAKLLVDKCSDLRTISFAKSHDNHEDYIKAADLIIVSGGTWLIHLNPGTHRRLTEKLVQSKKPIFGICLGAEALASYFGADLVKLPQRIEGVQVIEQDTLPISSELKVYQYHSWSIQNLPKSLKLVAGKADNVEAFRHENLPIWGTQFHPEARRRLNDGHLVFEEFLKSINIQEYK